MRRLNGFAAVEMIGALAICVLIGFLGYTALTKFDTKVATTQPPAPAVAKSTDAVGVAPAPLVTTTSDLDAATAALDSAEENDASDAAALDAALGEI